MVTTGFTISDGTDIYDLFEPIGTGSSQTTGFKNSDGVDIGTLFYPFNGIANISQTKATITGFKNSAGKDLNELFAKKGEITTIRTAGNYYYFYINSTTTIKFPEKKKYYYWLVGGGGAGGSLKGGSTTEGVSGGGGGGGVIYGSYTFYADTYTFEIGSGGVSSPTCNGPGGNGGETSIYLGTTKTPSAIIAKVWGGGGGAGNNGDGGGGYDGNLGANGGGASGDVVTHTSAIGGAGVKDVSVYGAEKQCLGFKGGDNNDTRVGGGGGGAGGDGDQGTNDQNSGKGGPGVPITAPDGTIIKSMVASGGKGGRSFGSTAYANPLKGEIGLEGSDWGDGGNGCYGTCGGPGYHGLITLMWSK